MAAKLSGNVEAWLELKFCILKPEKRVEVSVCAIKGE